MENYRNLSLSELQFERVRVSANQDLASMLPDDDQQKEMYLRLYGLQLTSIDNEIKKRNQPGNPSLLQRFKNLFTKPAIL